MKARTKIILKSIATVFFIFLLLRQIDFSQSWGILKTVNVWYFLLISPLWLLGIFLSAIKWRLILVEYGVNISYAQAFNLYWVGSFYNNFLPSSVGGDSYKFIYLQKKHEEKKVQIISSIILERGIGFLTMIFFGIFFGLFFIKSWESQNLAMLIYVGFAGLALVGIFLLFFSDFRVRYVSKYQIFNQLTNGINALLNFKNKKILVISFVISIVFLILSISYIYFSFCAFHSPLSFLLLLFLIPLINLAGILPLTINSIGLTEGVAAWLFVFFGVSLEVVLLVFFTSRIHLLLCTCTGGIRSFFKLD